jgi:hypothetical protein
MLDIHQGLFEMGMDSLMSVELKTRLEKSIGKPLPSTLTFNYPTIAELTEYITSAHFSIEKAEVATAPDVPDTAVTSTPVDEVDDLSEDELADLLLKKLQELK